MTKYIELEALKNRFAKRLVWLKKDIHDEYSLGLHDGCEYDTKLIDEIPAADIAPVVYGRWIRPHWENSNYCCNCSECGCEAMHRDYQWHKNGIYPICPNCGAKMLIKNKGDNDATKRLIDANALKDLRDKFIRGEIHFDDESDMVDKCPTINAVPIEELEHLRNELYEHDSITMEGLKRLNTLIGKYTTTHNGGANNG